MCAERIEYLHARYVVAEEALEQLHKRRLYTVSEREALARGEAPDAKGGDQWNVGDGEGVESDASEGRPPPKGGYAEKWRVGGDGDGQGGRTRRRKRKGSAAGRDAAWTGFFDPFAELAGVHPVNGPSGVPGRNRNELDSDGEDSKHSTDSNSS